MSPRVKVNYRGLVQGKFETDKVLPYPPPSHFPAHRERNQTNNPTWLQRSAILHEPLTPNSHSDFELERPRDMNDASQLGLANSVESVNKTCQDPDSGTYDFRRHIYLRQSFVTVFVASSFVSTKQQSI